MIPQVGETWVHCKGGEYEIICLSQHTETEEDMVVYKSRQMSKIWVRPLAMFISNHESGVPRFTRKE